MSRKATNSKSINIWLVSPRNAKLRRLQLSKSSLYTYSCLFIFFIAVAVSSAIFSFGSTGEQIATNSYANEVIETKLVKLKSENAKITDMQDKLVQRLEELSVVLKSANGLGVITDSELKDLTTIGVEEGIGGAEIDCEGDCFISNVNNNLSLSDISNIENIDSNSYPQLMNLLDQYSRIFLHLPIIMPGNGHVSSHYGPRRSPFSKRRSVHQGVDLSLPHGSPVISTADGVVKSVKRTSTYGLVIDIEHTPRVVTRYAHLSKTKVKKGQSVCREQMIALVGSTGRSTGPHLHYEVLVDGEQINPEKLMDLGKLINEVL